MNPILSQENLLFYLLQKLKPAAKASLCRERCQNAGFDEGEKKQEFCLCGKLLLPQARWCLLSLVRGREEKAGQILIWKAMFERTEFEYESFDKIKADAYAPAFFYSPFL